MFVYQESYKTQENAFDKALERLLFGKFSLSFRTTFGKFEKSTENLGKMILVQFREKNVFFRIVGKLSVNVRNTFVFAM